MNILQDYDFMDENGPLRPAAFEHLAMEKVLSILGVDYTRIEEADPLPGGFLNVKAEEFFSATLFTASLQPFRTPQSVTTDEDSFGPGVWLEARYLDGDHEVGVIFPNDLSHRPMVMLYREASDADGTSILQAIATVVKKNSYGLYAAGMLLADQPCHWSREKGCRGACQEAGWACIGNKPSSFGPRGECHDCKCRKPRRS
ncbi:hypothetical protein [Streptomyces sp. NBC_01236]|uniref:hypothetical protein n=1 Tax=Streptomyces sp. NBC_01236 TaxID=2903789 RepID=UPI002E131165|nr:hypothetical protein OG324_33950 [Streptomyces sp. NBC_01236]